MIRDETWGALRARSKSAGFWDEVLARKEKYVEDGHPPKDAKRMVLEDYAAGEAGASAADVGGERTVRSTTFGIELDPSIWNGKPKIGKSREVEWALDNMVFANVPPVDSPSSAAYGFYLIARRSPADAAKFLKDNLPKTLREEAKRGATFADDTAKLIEHTRKVEKMGSDAVHYEEELLRKRAMASGSPDRGER